MRVRLKRIYAHPQPEPGDGHRVLIDRLWPRGLSKTSVSFDAWATELSPSHELRRWFDHRPERWEEFQQRYRAELDGSEAAQATLGALRQHDRITLLFGSRETRYNNATALQRFLEAD